ncbi:hypothetical protein ACHAPU_009093 [Fusarium lateritium]
MAQPFENKSIRDTGILHRAFVPFSNSTIRRRLKNFTGTATVMDSRVVCVRPKVHDGISVAYTERTRWILNGTFTPEEIPPGLIFGDSPARTTDMRTEPLSVGIHGVPDISMDWAQEVPYAQEAGLWNIIQKLIYLGPGLVSSLDPRYPDVIQNKALTFNMSNSEDTQGYGLSYWIIGDKIPLMTGRGNLIFNISIVDDLSPLTDGLNPSASKDFYFSSSENTNKLVLTQMDDWLVLTVPQLPGWRLSVSMCFDSFTSVDLNTTITSPRPVNEPTFGSYDPVAQVFDTADILRQLGAVEPHQNYTDRDIMKLENTPGDLREQVKVWYDRAHKIEETEIRYPGQNFIRDSLKVKIATGAFMCMRCGLEFKGENSPHIGYQINNLVQQQIFQDVMRITRDSARAWQAFFTNIGRMAYYDRLPFFDLEKKARTSWFQNAQFPGASRGFWAVIVLTCIHVGLTALIVLWFIMKTELSRAGNNIWQCIAQTNYDGDKDLLRSAMTLEDDGMKTLLEKEGLNQRYVRLRVTKKDKNQVWETIGFADRNDLGHEAGDRELLLL